MKTPKTLSIVTALSCSTLLLAFADEAGEKAKEKPVQHAGQGASTQTNSPAAKPTDESKELPVIGHVERRDKVITIKAGPKGTVYSVATKDGRILHEELSADELQAKVPELHEFLKQAIAGGDARLDGRKLDAGLRTSSESIGR